VSSCYVCTYNNNFLAIALKVNNSKGMMMFNITYDEVLKYKDYKGSTPGFKSLPTHIRQYVYGVEFQEKYKDLKPIKGYKHGMYYVYVYTIKDKIVYIGKGTNAGGMIPYYRAADIWNHKKCRPFKDDIKVIILTTFDFEHEALEYESKLICKIGLENLLNVV
jgi:hypothetical protein